MTAGSSAPSRPGALRTVGITLAAAGVIVGLSALSIRLAPPGSPIASWWPAAGVSVLIALQFPRRSLTWCIVLLSVFAATAAGNLIGGRPPLVALCFGAANAVEAAIVSGILRGPDNSRPELRTPADLARLFVASAAGPVVLGGLVAATVAGLSKGDGIASWLSATPSHAAAILLITPLGIVDARDSLRTRRWEIVAQWLVCGALVATAFGLNHGLPLAFLPFAALVWGATRLPVRQFLVQLVLVAVAVTALTYLGRGPFNSDSADSGLVQLFLVTVCAVFLTLAVLTRQQRREAETREAALRNAIEREHAAAQQLMTLDRMKDELISTVSHELRTPLAGIMGYTEMLNDGDVGQLTKPQREVGEVIERSGQRLGRVVEDLLTNHSPASLPQRVTTRIDLGTVVQTVLADLRPLADQRGHRVHFSPPALPAEVWAVDDEMHRVFVNLIGNAIKFTPDGGDILIDVSASVGMAEVTIRDSGIGMSPADREKAFDVGYRSADGVIQAEGSGLGLTIVAHLVAQNGGSIAVASDLGEGTQVTVSFPRP